MIFRQVVCLERTLLLFLLSLMHSKRIVCFIAHCTPLLLGKSFIVLTANKTCDFLVLLAYVSP